MLHASINSAERNRPHDRPLYELIDVKDTTGTILRIGHRGAAGYSPENSLAALDKAIELGADLVEVDVRRTRDGVLVLFHDEQVDRTTDGHGKLEEFTLHNLRKLDTGLGQPVPLLEEALKRIQGRIGVILELKVEGTATQACRVVESSGYSGPIMYASFLHRELMDVRRMQPSAETLVLAKDIGHDFRIFATHAQFTHVGLAVDCVTPGLVTALHAEGLKVFAFTANTSADIRRMKTCGVDGIISNFPDRI
jgi:glycerophosphoryl diester phosphodiesterase